MGIRPVCQMWRRYFEGKKHGFLQTSTSSELINRSVLSPLLPEAAIYYLEQYGSEKYAEVFLGQFENPEIIWNSEMRCRLVFVVTVWVKSANLGAFFAGFHCTFYSGRKMCFLKKFLRNFFEAATNWESGRSRVRLFREIDQQCQGPVSGFSLLKFLFSDSNNMYGPTVILFIWNFFSILINFFRKNGSW